MVVDLFQVRCLSGSSRHLKQNLLHELNSKIRDETIKVATPTTKINLNFCVSPYKHYFLPVY